MLAFSDFCDFRLTALARDRTFLSLGENVYEWTRLRPRGDKDQG